MPPRPAHRCRASRWPSLKAALSERVKVIEDLQNQAMVQREAAVLLAQRIELLSTKGWKDAQAVADALRTDVTHWQAQADALEGDANWSCVDTKYTPMIESSRAQLLVVWDAFSAALGQAVAADADAAAPLPPVPVWADQLRAARGLPAEAAARARQAEGDPAVREEQRQKAAAAVTPVLEKVEQEVSEGHGKASAGAAAALRNAFKEHGRHLDAALEAARACRAGRRRRTRRLAALARRPAARRTRGQGRSAAATQAQGQSEAGACGRGH